MSVNIRDYVSDDHVESIGEIARSQSAIIQALSIENGNLQTQLQQKENIIKEVKQQLLNKKNIVEKSKYFKLVYYIDWNIKQEWDKRIVNKIDEIIKIIDEGNK